MNNNNLIRTDLAMECRNVELEGEEYGIIYTEKEKRGLKYNELEITTEEGVKIIGKDIGKYITIECPKLWLAAEEEVESTEEVTAELIKELLPQECGCVLCVGLGNREITSDALGPKTADGLLVTRHIKGYNDELFENLGQLEVAAIAPGVVGQTGIETFELIKGAVDKVHPDAVVCVDALAARSVDRLACTIQLSNTGISPGSGIGNRRIKIDSESLGVPVISAGVPTVVDSSTLVYDALGQAGIENVDNSLQKVLENGRNFFVTLKESDIAVSELSKLLAGALNRAFLRRE